ncbi:unnamed protein product [Arabis nemorensis]|uniref:Uncharacterized protein n=1 Tax=Arabis nemorensis TaxID=586526 RepID=A0A565AZN5_9BRAS|nr:unnamed protein product [Arabis nemorensis]
MEDSEQDVRRFVLPSPSVSAPNSPSIFEISSDSAKSVERADSQAQVESPIPMPLLPERAPTFGDLSPQHQEKLREIN